MSYKDHFRYGRDDIAELRLWVYFQRPEATYDLDRIQYYDRSAVSDIQKLESALQELKEYRQDLARRYSDLATMPFSYKLYLEREKSWSNKKVTYTVRLVKVFPDGKEIDEQREVFPGSERKKAFELFSSLKKARPGILAVENTQKKQWET